MKLSIASLGAEPGARYLQQVRLAEQLGFHAFFHNDKKWARELFSRLGAATQVTWAMRGSCAYMAKLMGLFLDMDKMIGRDFEIGLANLKAQAER